MRLVINSHALDYDISGSGAETIVFIHALGVTREMWWPQVEHFQRDYRVVVYDAAGHDSPPPTGGQPSLADYAHDLHGLMLGLGIERPRLVGISMGGMLAQVYAIHYPRELTSLVLACTTAGYADEARRQLEQRAAMAEGEGMSPLVDATVGRWFTPDFREEHPEVINRIRAMLATADPRAYAMAARAVAAVDTRGDLPRIAVPALILRAEHDASMGPEAAAALRDGIPRAEIQVIDDAAHLCSVQRPDAFNRAVSDFLRKTAASSPLPGGGTGQGGG
ncbi:MAG: alpha/beta fold hydrolase [Chloroflexi bacterium]|nr:alpha/beta fold hydrolase [Chloroflexota bacterium]